MNANMNLYPVENVKRKREGMPWTEDERNLLFQYTKAGFHPNAIAFALKRNKNEVILQGLEMGIFAVERVIPLSPAQAPQNHCNENDCCNEFSHEPRTLDKIQYMANAFSEKIWLARHLYFEYRIDQGMDTVDPEIWARALEEEDRIVRKYGSENLGSYSDIEWGMLNGKLSALRWVLGCEWDMPDT